MTEAPSIDPKASALLLMDYQRQMVGMAPDAAALVAQARKLLDAARWAGMLVVYVAVRFRAGHPEINAHHPIFGAVKASGRLVEGDPLSEITPELAPRDGEPVVTKRRVGALWGTDLEPILRANGIRTLLLSGISTSGVVLSTLRLAADMDYRCVVVRDACADPDEEVHRVLMDKVFPRQAQMADVASVVATLAEAGPAPQSSMAE